MEGGTDRSHAARRKRSHAVITCSEYSYARDNTHLHRHAARTLLMAEGSEARRAQAWWSRMTGGLTAPVRNYPVHSVNEDESKEDLVAKQRCEQWKDDLLRTSPMVRFMVKHLALIDCNPVTPREQTDVSQLQAPPKLLISTCPPDIAGGFSPSAPGRPTSEAGILLCANRIYSKSHLEDTLSHEMIHWWDHCRFKVDWSNLRHHACSEIRAASLSGDCRFMREMHRRNYSFLRQHQNCTKRRAVLSVRSNAACPDEETAIRVVDEVWDSCFNDTRPFDEIY